jgi:hypothetical protein
VTKTSIWADEKGGSHSGRLKEKLEGIRRGRIKEMRYILHLSYWRDSVERERAKPNAGSRAALQYRRKLMNLLSNLEDFASCPPEKVLVIPGEIEDPAPPHRFGLYQRGRRSLLIFGYDAPGRETLPRLFVRSHPELLRYFENQFTEQWEKYLDHIESHLDKGRGYTRGVREYVIEVLREELAWVESRIDASALRQRSGEQKTIVAPAGPPHTP